MILLWALKASSLFLGYLALRPFFHRARTRRFLGAICFCLAALLPLAEVSTPVRVSLHLTSAPVETAATPNFLFWVWLAGFASACIHFLFGALAIRRLYRRSSPLESAGRWELRIAETPFLGTAITWGWPKAVVLLPADASNWPERQRQAVILHELAHIRAGDILFHGLALLVRAALWFNPLAWIAAAKFRDDFEASADEAVLEAGVRPTDYATVLLSMASGYRGSAALAAVRQTHLGYRIQRILQNKPSSRGIGGAVCGSLLAGLFLCVATAQLDEPHSKAWLEGYEAARRYVAEHGAEGEGTPRLTSEDRRKIEMDAAARLKGSR